MLVFQNVCRHSGMILVKKEKSKVLLGAHTIAGVAVQMVISQARRMWAVPDRIRMKI